MDFASIEELMEKTKEIVGKTFRELDRLNLLNGSSKDKGVLGKIVETGFYGYELNNKAEADFANIGVELKVAGFTVLKSGEWSAKERISLSQINYNTILDYPFDMSSVVNKSNNLLFIWYEYVNDTDKGDFIIKDFQLYNLEKDKPIIENDYNSIQEKVRKGLAHELSEGDSVILGAATKGSAGKKQRQPYSDILASTRAFSLKNSFLRGVLREHQAGYKIEIEDQVSPESWVWERMKKYKGLTQLEILRKLNPEQDLEVVPKNIGDMLKRRILGTDEKLKENQLFSKSEYEIKNIPINSDGYPLEKATFSTLNLDEFKDSWEESRWKLFFEESTFLYIGYIENEDNTLKNGYRRLHCLFKVTFTSEEIKKFGETYSLIQRAINDNDINKLPTASVCPDASLVISTKSNKGGAYQEFFKGKSTTCFMFNKDFLANKFKKAKKLD